MIRPFSPRQLTFKWAGGVESTWDEEPDLLRPVHSSLVSDLLGGAAGAGDLLYFGYVEHLRCSCAAGGAGAGAGAGTAGWASRTRRTGRTRRTRCARARSRALHFNFVVDMSAQLRGIALELIGGSGSVGQGVAAAGAVQATTDRSLAAAVVHAAR